MSQHDYNLVNQAGALFLADLNAALAAIVTLNEGPTEPAVKFPFMFWPDTTNYLLKQRNHNNTAWLTIGKLLDDYWGLTTQLSIQYQLYNSAAAGGSADTITAVFTPTLISLSDKLLVKVVAAYANATTTPTFSPDGLTAKVIVKGNNQPLAAGDIPGAGYPCYLWYSTAYTHWVLLNPYVDTSGVIIPYALVEDVKAQGTPGGTFTAGAQQTRDLNTESLDPDGIVSLASNQITLQAGTYRVRGSAPAYNVQGHSVAWVNVTDDPTGAAAVWGTSEYALNIGVSNRSEVIAEFTIAGPKIFELRHQCKNTYATTGLGIAVDITGRSEKFARMEIWKLA